MARAFNSSLLMIHVETEGHAVVHKMSQLFQDKCRKRDFLGGPVKKGEKSVKGVLRSATVWALFTVRPSCVHERSGTQ